MRRTNRRRAHGGGCDVFVGGRDGAGSSESQTDESEQRHKAQRGEGGLGCSVHGKEKKAAQTEALYATLLGWEQRRQPEFFCWYEKLWQLCLDHYADWENGEWRQKLDRSLSPVNDVIALPVKDPFHLPRSLILQIELLENGFPAGINRRESSGSPM